MSSEIETFIDRRLLVQRLWHGDWTFHNTYYERKCEFNVSANIQPVEDRFQIDIKVHKDSNTPMCASSHEVFSSDPVYDSFEQALWAVKKRTEIYVNALREINQVQD